MKTKQLLVYAALAAALFTAILLSLSCGAARLTPQDFWHALTGAPDAYTARLILFRLRAPRLIAALLAGIGLSTGGLLLQTVTGNSLASPNVIGVNSGAGAGLMLALCLAPGVYALPPFAAFAGALATTLCILTLCARDGRRSTLVLAGVALSSLLSALISFLSLRFPDLLTSYAAFAAGSLSGVFFSDLVLPSVIILIVFAGALLLAPRLNTLCLGDSLAASMGVRVRALRTVSIVLACAGCAAVVSFAGLLGFVGLIVPHAARRLVGQDLRRLTPVCALLGGVLVAFSDLAGRVLFAPTELPVGIITAFLGAPFFLFLLLKRRGA